VDAVLIGRRALTIIVVALLLFVGGVGSVLSIVAISNSDSIEHIQDLREDRLADVARADVLVCEENNRQDAILTALLKASDAARRLEVSRPPLTKKEKKLLRDSLASVVQRDCRRLPSATKPFKR
jgi:hypothetical protein